MAEPTNGVEENSGMVQQTLAEWQQEAKERFGETDNWHFVCPRCGFVQPARLFREHGLDVNSAYQECIGRHVKELGCNWAAYGLLGTLGKGRKVIAPPNDRVVEVFDFAPATKEVDDHVQAEGAGAAPVSDGS